MKRIIKPSLLAAYGIICTFLSSGCGSREESDRLKVPLGMTIPSDQALNLLDGLPLSDWTIKISGCKSGYTATVTSTTASPRTSVNLYKFDRGCLAGLESFTFGGELYTKDGGGVLNTAVGTKALFKSTNSKQMTIGVAAQLDSPLTASSKAEFKYFENKAGLPYSANYSQAQTLSISGVESSNFEIFAADLKAIADTTGAPTFTLKFECGTTITVPANTCTTSGGDVQPMAKMTVKVVADSYGGVLTYDQAQTLFATAGTAVTVDATIGTKGGMRLDAVGAGPLDSNLNQLVVIRYQATVGNSYRYFKLIISRPVN